MNQKIRVGVIGVGSMGQNHARVYFYSDQAELVAVADSNPRFVQAVTQQYHTKGYIDYKEMIEREHLDAVSIAVPTSLHAEVAMFALRHKKHVLLEKPIASTEAEAQAIIDCAKEQGVKLMIGHIERFNTAIVELKQRLNRGDLGEIYKIDVQRIGPFPTRITDVGVVIDLSVHDLDIIEYLIEDEPVRVFAETQRKLHHSCEDSVTALIRYRKGVLAVLNVNYLSPTKIRQLQIFGKKGMFSVNYLDQELYFYENKSFHSDNWESVSEGDIKKIIIQKREPLHVEIEAFLNAILTDNEPPVRGEHGLDVLRTANCLLASAKQGTIINLDQNHQEEPTV